ncbi:hypothetical protein [Parapedobacter tibetensis]|uniref:hypothetical protein n=1 Tax=Parapedobacter tibetensis TaxID=2972951 RepID=UPI00214D2D42|nr:hypothetical protein [Parapedobacter tibetensis]
MKLYRRLLLAFSLFLLAYFAELAINIACGPEPDPYDYYVSYFHDNTAGEGYVPFTFTELRFLYDDEEPESEAQINCREWADYLAKGVAPEDVYQVMYRTDSATDTVIKGFLNREISTLPDSLSANTYLQALARQEKARDYFNFAKAVEPFAVTEYDHYSAWNPEPVDTASMATLAERALQQLPSVKRDKFLTLRYAYQAARMYHYSADYEKCLEVCSTRIEAVKNKSAVKGWAQALQAGATRRLGEPALAAYRFSKVFASNPERRVQAYKNFHYIKVDLQEVLTLTRSKEEEAVVWAIDGFTHTDFNMQALAKVYALAPQSPMVGSLLTREINKLESRINEAPYDRIWGWWGFYADSDSLKQLAMDQAQTLSKFVLQLANDKRYPEPQLGTIAAAYLAWLQHEDEDAHNLLAGLNLDQMPERLSDQARIIELLIQARAIQLGKQMDEQEMVPALKWLDGKRTAEMKAVLEHDTWTYYHPYGVRDSRFSRTARNLYQSVLAPHYMQLGDTAAAALMMVKGGYKPHGENPSLFKNIAYNGLVFWQQSIQPNALVQLGEWKKKGSKRPLIDYIAAALETLAPNDYFELLGTAYLREHDYANALKAFEQLPRDFQFFAATNWYGTDEEDTLHADLFISPIKDYPKTYGKEVLNKRQFAQRMLDLQQRIESDPERAATYYFEMANGVYQTGTFGNSWYLISYQWSSADNYLKSPYTYAGDYLEARQAAIWYEKARELSRDDEFKAKCTFMLSKCEQKLFGYASTSEYYRNSWGAGSDPFWLFSMENRYFKELGEAYRHTSFYKRAIGECSYLADFMVRANGTEPAM